jgi:hypothetical protein
VKGRGTLERVHRVECFLCGQEKIIKHWSIMAAGATLKSIGWKQRNVVGWGYDDGWVCPNHEENDD